MTESSIAVTYDLNMTLTLALATVLLIIGHYVKKAIPLLRKFFIPAPVIGGILFSFVTLAGHHFHLFSFTFDDQLKNLLMMAFFTSIGFTASFKMLIKGGMSVAIFLMASMILICVQNGVGIGIAKMFGLNPLLGLATGSIPLTGGHGTSAAFGPELERLGLDVGLSVSIAAATFGLVAGSIVGGPIGKLLLKRHKIICNPSTDDTNNDMLEGGKLSFAEKQVTESELFMGCAYLIISMGLGSFIILGLKKIGIILPAYLGPMIIAAILRNCCDMKHWHMPIHTINIVGSLALQFFLAMALMTMRLWELAALAIPLITILLVQTLIICLFTYFITFKVMGSDYDAAVIAVGHCGFGMGATPNAMANMETFTGANGPSPKAFFVVPIVGALFIDFVNAFIITTFMNMV